MNPLSQSVSSNSKGPKDSSSAFTTSFYMKRRESLPDLDNISDTNEFEMANSFTAKTTSLVADKTEIDHDDVKRIIKERSFTSENSIHFSLENLFLVDDGLYYKALFFSLYWFRNRHGHFSFFLTCWNLFLIATTLVGVGFFVFLATSPDRKLIAACVGAILQFVFNAVIVYYAQNICKQKHVIPKIEDFNMRCDEIMNYSFKCGIFFLCFQVLFLIIGSTVGVEFDDGILLIIFVSFIPLCVMLSGLIVMAVANLKFQKLYVNHVLHKLNNQTLTEKGFYRIKALLDILEESSVINFVLGMGVSGLVFAIFSIQDISGPVFFCSVFLRILIGMIPMVYEIIQVNDVTDKMNGSIFDEKWSKPELHSTRTGLFMAISQKPLMVKILGKQPSSAQIYSTIFAAVLSFVASIILKQVRLANV